MAAQQPLVRFYDLSGPKPWSPACWCTRYALNYKEISYTTTKLSYPGIRPTCEKLFSSMDGLEATVPIIEILGPRTEDYKALNDSTPIAELLNERFTEDEGFKMLKGLEEIRVYEEETDLVGRGLIRWIMYDVWNNALDAQDGSKEYFRETREKRTKCPLEEVTAVIGGGEEAVLKLIRDSWVVLRDRMKGEDGSGEPTFKDFYDAALVRWVEAASREKYEKLLMLYGDDTFEKLMKKVEKYEYAG